MKRAIRWEFLLGEDARSPRKLAGEAMLVDEDDLAVIAERIGAKIATTLMLHFGMARNDS